MHIERIRFDAVFDTNAGRGDFSFWSEGRARYGVNLRRGLVPQAGSTWLVALAKSDDWSTVMGWRDLQGGKVEFRESTALATLAGMDIVVWSAMLLATSLPLILNKGAALAAFAVIACAVARGLYKFIDCKRRVREALESADPADPADPAPGQAGIQAP